MPALSPTMTQGNIAKWYVKAGDEIAAGTVLADIETDKATLAFENQEDGYIAAIVRPDGSKDVPVGETVAIVVEEQSDVAAFANYSGDAAESAAPAATQAEAPSAEAADAAPAEQPAAAAEDAGSWPDYTVSSNLSTTTKPFDPVSTQYQVKLTASLVSGIAVEPQQCR